MYSLARKGGIGLTNAVMELFIGSLSVTYSVSRGGSGQFMALCMGTGRSGYNDSQQGKANVSQPKAS